MVSKPADSPSARPFLRQSRYRLCEVDPLAFDADLPYQTADARHDDAIRSEAKERTTRSAQLKREEHAAQSTLLRVLLDGNAGGQCGRLDDGDVDGRLNHGRLLVADGNTLTGHGWAYACSAGR